MTDATGKVVVLTGASSGIGEATAKKLAEAGARLVLGARGLERLDAISSALSAQGVEVVHSSTDVRKRSDVAQLVALAQERFGRVDVMISSAGIGPIAPLDDLRVQEWEATIDTNLKGLLYAVAAALPVFRAQGTGHFVNLASTAAHRIVPNMAVYAASKAAVRAFSEGFAAGSRRQATRHGHLARLHEN